MLKHDLDTPALLVDIEKLGRNINDMASLATAEGVHLRPHAKTHKSPEIGKMQIKAGAKGITVAKLSEAEVFVDAGFTDILICYPIVGAVKQRRLFNLLQRAKIKTVVDHVDTAANLSRAAIQFGLKLDVLMEVDTGMHRCGVSPGEPACELAFSVDRLPGLNLRGLLTHEGHAMWAGSPSAVREAGLKAGHLIVDTAERIRSAGLEIDIVSVGLTATTKVTASLPGVTEARPGTYAFYDRGGVLHGLVPWERCAATVLTTAVTRPSRDRIIFDAGSKSLSSDSASVRPPVEGYGHIVGHPDWVIERLSEEHGCVKILPDDVAEMGAKFEIIPNHICPVFNLFDEIIVIRQNTVIDRWAVSARGKLT